MTRCAAKVCSIDLDQLVSKRGRETGPALLGHGSGSRNELFSPSTITGGTIHPVHAIERKVDALRRSCRNSHSFHPEYERHVAFLGCAAAPAADMIVRPLAVPLADDGPRLKSVGVAAAAR